MHRTHAITFAATALLLATGASAAQAQDESRVVAGGGITAPGWMGKVDANEAARGGTVEGAKLMAHGADLHVTTGPAITYWNPANTATGDYTVRATFTEADYMGLNNHPHPYGIFIGGTDMGTDQQRYLYCAAYGNGNFIVRGFGPAAFQVNGRRGEAHDAVNKAAGKGSSVTQEIAVSVKGDDVTCAINGTVVGTYPKSSIIAADKLTSTDGVYGVRFGHNTSAVVAGLTKTTP